MLVPDEGKRRIDDRPQTGVLNPEAEVDVCVAVPLELRIEGSDPTEVAAAQRHEVALDAIDVRARGFREVEAVRRRHAPPADESDVRIVEGAKRERADDLD